MPNRSQMARSIRLRCGEEAYLLYKYDNVVPDNYEEMRCSGIREQQIKWHAAQADPSLLTSRESGSLDRARDSTAYKTGHKRRDSLMRHHHMTLDQYETHLAAQNGLCKVCGTDQPGSRSPHFCVDHCHKTGKFRGLLCNNCNSGLGLLGDTAGSVRKALDYLKDFEN